MCLSFSESKVKILLSKAFGVQSPAFQSLVIYNQSDCPNTSMQPPC